MLTMNVFFTYLCHDVTYLKAGGSLNNFNEKNDIAVATFSNKLTHVVT